MGDKTRIVVPIESPSCTTTMDDNVDTNREQQEQDQDPNQCHQQLDWILTNYDRSNSEPQSLDQELHRLQTLRSYLVLDREREPQFERLTALASRILDVPIALVSLVDLGRQWFVSGTRNSSPHSFFGNHGALPISFNLFSLSYLQFRCPIVV